MVLSHHSFTVPTCTTHTEPSLRVLFPWKLVQCKRSFHGHIHAASYPHPCATYWSLIMALSTTSPRKKEHPTNKSPKKLLQAMVQGWPSNHNKLKQVSQYSECQMWLFFFCYCTTLTTNQTETFIRLFT